MKQMMRPNQIFTLLTKIRIVCMRTDYLVKSFLLINLFFAGQVIGMGEAPKLTLYEACFSGHKSAVDWYINSDCNLNLFDRDGDTAMHCAILGGYHKIVKRLIRSNRVDINLFQVKREECFAKNALMLAVESSNTKILKLLVRSHIQLDKPDFSGITALSYASTVGNAEKKVKILLRAGANPKLSDNEGATAFHHACARGKLDAVKYLSS